MRRRAGSDPFPAAADSDGSGPAADPAPPSPDAAHATLGYLINLSARLLAQSLRARNGPDGILPGQFPIVLQLLRDNGLSQRDLCARVRIEQSTMANTLKRMERGGIITRALSRGNRRQQAIYLTPKGRALAEEAVENAAEVNRLALSGLDECARLQLRQMLLTMTVSLERDIGARPAGDDE
jgi:DNA-binding MarR family transcriptional regulator